MRTGLSLLLICIVGAAAWRFSRETAGAAEPPVRSINFGRDIRPILADTCFKCHGPDEKARDSALRLDVREGAFADLGDYRAIVPGEPDKSELVRRITSDDPELHMPPPESGRKLSPQQIELLKRWIEQGAPWEEHWSFVPPKPAPLPAVKAADWARNAIDCFVLARLEQEQLPPSPQAAKEMLIRRATLDLTGLPPTLAEVDAFLADEAPDAYERLVERLLASPRYGEHMAIGWLDAARYSDTNGYQSDRTRTMWPWRDWVVNALNANMPFNQFTIEQLAGDLLPDASAEARLASGFNRNHPLNGEGGRIAEESRVEYVVDRVETTATVWLGLTAGCGRCHDHKYDPLSQQEFYSLYAFFNSIDESGAVDAGGNAKPVMKLATYQQRAAERELRNQIARLEAELSRPVDEAEFSAWQKETLEKLEAEMRELAWLPVEPVEFASDNGQEMKLLDDGSIFVSGKNPERDSYTVVVKTDMANIRAVRLEALAHESFTNGGLARSDSGNFVLTEIEIAARKTDGAQEPVKIRDAQADFEQGGFPVKNAFDGNAGTGWAVYHPQDMKINRTAKFLFDQPLAGGKETTLVLRLKHESPHKHHNLGRFRLCVSASENPPLKEEDGGVPAAVAAALKIEAKDRSNAQQKQVLDYYRRTAPPFASLQSQLADARSRLAELEKQFPEVMVMSERAQPRETFVLKVGQYDQPDKSRPVQPGVPACLPPLRSGEASATATRLDLARWIVDPSHPLTARVAVNRIWQHHFGTGLVKTTEDFGVQGEPPSHPALLDWLALELIRSGWDVKHLQRLIVTSSTYRQSSRVAAELAQRDPENRLLARGPRLRMSSFAIRDQALALSGLLVGQIGGPPVQPYQPEGVWEDFSLGQIKYQRDSGEKLYRRSLYTFWRRSVGPTMLFDTADRLVCTVRPRRTNTPLHALTLLNDITYVEAARMFAERIVREGGDMPEARLAWAFRAATSRPPTDAELAVLQRAFDRALARYQADPESAKKLLATGDYQRNEQLPLAEHAAYTTVANVVLNLDEVITRE